jgi:hypothetical protein
MAWRKMKLVRKIRIQENCEPWKELAVARRELTNRAKVARQKERSHKGPSVEQGRQ